MPRRFRCLRILPLIAAQGCGLFANHEPCGDAIRAAFEKDFAPQIELLRSFSVKRDDGFDPALFASKNILSAWLREAPASNGWRRFKQDSATSSSHNEYGDSTAGELHLPDGRAIEFCGYVGTNTVTGGEFELRVRRSFFAE